MFFVFCFQCMLSLLSRLLYGFVPPCASQKTSRQVVHLFAKTRSEHVFDKLAEAGVSTRRFLENVAHHTGRDLPTPEAIRRVGGRTCRVVIQQPEGNGSQKPWVRSNARRVIPCTTCNACAPRLDRRRLMPDTGLRSAPLSSEACAIRRAPRWMSQLAAVPRKLTSACAFLAPVTGDAPFLAS